MLRKTIGKMKIYDAEKVKKLSKKDTAPRGAKRDDIKDFDQ